MLLNSLVYLTWALALIHYQYVLPPSYHTSDMFNITHRTQIEGNHKQNSKNGALSRRTSTAQEEGIECFNKSAEIESEKQKNGLQDQVEKPRFRKAKRPWTKLSTALVLNGLGYCHDQILINKYPGYLRCCPDNPLPKGMRADRLTWLGNSPLPMFTWLHHCQALYEP